MGLTRHRQLLWLLVALVLPSLVIGVLGWRVLADQRKLDTLQAEEYRQVIANELGSDFRDLLNRIKEQVIAAPDSSDPSVALVAWAEGGALVFPWESAEPKSEPFRRAADDLKKITEDVTLLAYRQKQAQAAETLRAEIQQRRGQNMERDYLRILLARTLKEWDGHKQEAYDLWVELLKLPSDAVDDAARPEPLWQGYAANVLIDEGVRERDVLARVEQDLGSLAALARWNVSLRVLLGRLRNSRDAAVARAAESDLNLLERRLERLDQLRRFPQAEALRAAFSTTLGVTPDKWPPFVADEEMWFIGMGPQTGGRSLVVVVLAADIMKSIERANVERKRTYAGMPIRIAPGGDVGYSMGDGLPGWRAILGPQSVSGEATVGTVLGMSLQQWFYALSLALILGLTFFGGHLLLRDTRRESRMAELRSQFVSSVSHELKTPLTGIRMLAETLQNPTMSDPQTHAEYLETIVGETERLTRLLNNVLDFSKIERGQKNYHLQPASLSDVLRDAARAMRFPLAEQGFDFRLEIPDDIPPARIDRDAMEQAVLNLISNAMKYSGESRRIDLQLSSENGNAQIQVIDHGVGIAPEERKRIFEKFYRVQTPDSRAISGTGLGLALVAHIVEAHGGRVEVESALGKGSTFTIQVPLVPSGASTGAVAAPAETAS